MSTGDLGKVYEEGEIIVRQGEMGDSMYVIQEGEVEVLYEGHGEILSLAVLHEGDFFGEMAIFDPRTRAATVRALGRVRVLTVDKKTLLRSIQQDPSLALRLLETLSARLRLEDEAEFNMVERALPETSQPTDISSSVLCHFCPLHHGFPKSYTANSPQIVDGFPEQ